MTLSAPTALAERVRATLDEVHDPCSVGAGFPLGLDEMGLVKDVTVDCGRVVVDLRLTSPSCYLHSYFIDEIRKHVEPLDGVASVRVVFDAGLEWEPGLMSADVRRRRAQLLRRRTAAPTTPR